MFVAGPFALPRWSLTSCHGRRSLSDDMGLLPKANGHLSPVTSLEASREGGDRAGIRRLRGTGGKTHAEQRDRSMDRVRKRRQGERGGRKERWRRERGEGE